MSIMEMFNSGDLMLALKATWQSLGLWIALIVGVELLILAGYLVTKFWQKLTNSELVDEAGVSITEAVGQPLATAE